MSKVIKNGEREAVPYVYPMGYQLAPKSPAGSSQNEPIKIKDTYEEQCLKEAVEKADAILNTARREGELLKKEYRKKGYEEGFEEGTREGYEKARKEHLEQFERERQEAKDLLKDCLESIDQKKQEMLEHYKDDLMNIAVAIAEKVIRISLKTSGETIKHMIIAAAGNLEKREWAKIYVSKYDVDLMLEGDVEFLNSLSELSTDVKIIKMENEEQGTCILELPDEIVDSSVNTQMANIREILDNA